jgi:hypothetical protein
VAPFYNFERASTAYHLQSLPDRVQAGGGYDPLVDMTVEFAREYLRRVQHKIGELDRREVELHRLENRP